jgi:hypothetical protein
MPKNVFNSAFNATKCPTIKDLTICLIDQLLKCYNSCVAVIYVALFIAVVSIGAINSSLIVFYVQNANLKVFETRVIHIKKLK